MIISGDCCNENQRRMYPRQGRTELMDDFVEFPEKASDRVACLNFLMALTIYMFRS